MHDVPAPADHARRRSDGGDPFGIIVETLQRYFHVERFVPLGGAIAYPILTHNARLFGLTDQSEQAIWVDHVLRADEDFLSDHPDSTLFAYFAAKPNKEALQRPEALAR